MYAIRSYYGFEVCGLWQPAQSPLATGVCRCGCFKISANSSWQPTQTFVIEPDFKRKSLAAFAGTFAKIDDNTTANHEIHAH